uniref:Uncharacterized protein n=1 Tax=Biomphalaria glabrata TaxID=6526 RepID=A0A2C9L7U3_BIOGL
MTKTVYSEHYLQFNASSRTSFTEVSPKRNDSSRSLKGRISSTTVDTAYPTKKDEFNRPVYTSISNSTVTSYTQNNYDEGRWEKLCCFKFCRQKKSPEELHKILHAGVRRMSETSTPLNAYYQQQKKNECSYYESGYLSKSTLTGELKSMRDLRKASHVTANLPEPEVAISNSNSRRLLAKGSKQVFVGETDVHEINLMLQSRLNGGLSIDTLDADQKGEALLKCNRTGKDYTSLILSQLVNEADTRRMSVQSDRRSSNFRSSFSKVGLDLKLEKMAMKKGLKPEELSDSEFLNRLTDVSTIVKTELEKDWNFTQNYIKTLEKFVKLQTSQKKIFDMGTERWMVILYTTSEQLDGLTNFRCLLTRLILQQHHVAYEERDIALANMPYKEELKKRLDTNGITVPYVFAYGVTIGNCQVIYALHKLKMMDSLFKNFIMPPNKYNEWLNSRHLGKGSGLKIDVKVSSFPALNLLASLQSEIKLSSVDAEKTKVGKEIVRRARTRWIEISKIGFKQPDLLRFVLLKRTIILALTMMNDIYQTYLTKRNIGQHMAKKRRFSWMK